MSVSFIKTYKRWRSRQFLGLLAILLAGCSCSKKDGAKALIAPGPVTDSILEVMDSVADPVDTLGGPLDTVLLQHNFLTYLIKSGEHYSDREGIALLPHDSVAIKVIFDSSAVYQTKQAANQKDWNKLIGFSDCSTHHHTNSIRAVWRYNQERGIQLGAYWYKNGQRYGKELKTVQIFDTVNVVVTAKDSLYTVRVDDMLFTEARDCNSSAFRYWLFPYFGGDEAAPQDITIRLAHIYPIRQ
mgnify:CR=1 FL=1